MKEYFFEIGKKYRVYHGGTPTEQYLQCDEIHESVVWFYDSSGNLICKYNKRRIMDKIKRICNVFKGWRLPQTSNSTKKANMKGTEVTLFD